MDKILDSESLDRLRDVADIVWGRDDPLRSLDGIVHSAHRGGALPEALLQIGHSVVADLAAILAGRPERQLQYATPEKLRGLGRI